MGQGVPRSEMDVRICFRVREHRDVDLILRGMLAADRQAHTLNVPGKFQIAPVLSPPAKRSSTVEREVDSDEVLPTDERCQRAQHALRAQMLRPAKRSATARRRPR